MEIAVLNKVGELLMRKSAIMELMRYIEERAKEGDIKEIRNFAREICLSDMVLKEREE